MGTEDLTVQAARVALGPNHLESVEVQSKLDPALKGTVTLSLPDGRDLMKIAVIQARMREGVPYEELDPLSRMTCTMLSTLAVVVRSAPDWWYHSDGKGGPRIAAPERIKDLDLLWEIYGRFVAIRDTFPGDEGADSGHRESAG